MPKKILEYPMLPLFRRFINENKKGKRLQSNGKKIKKSSIKNYQYLESLLIKFHENKKFYLRISNTTNFTKKQFDDEKKYWKDFYFKFTSFLYDDLNHFDNHVGRLIKLLKSFFNYLFTEKGINIGIYYKKFYAPSEDIEIVVITPERLNHLIENLEIENTLSKELKEIKDIFVFGCSVALRYSDLINLTSSNLEIINQRVYLKVQSLKTQTYSKVKLPDFSIQILKKYNNSNTSRLLPYYTKTYLNIKIKKLLELYGFTEIIGKKRQKRGVPEIILRKGKEFRFCDLACTHTMRRSGITILLSLGMKEQMVRQISGHSANSKEFYRYVSFAQNYIDTEIDMVHKRLSEKKLENV